MAEDATLSRARLILSAVQLAIDADIRKLRQLTATHPDVLTLELLLRILLTYLPESVEPASYTGFLSDLITGNLSVIDEANLDAVSPAELTNDEARRQVHKLHLLSLADPNYTYDSSVDTFTLFLLHRAHRIDAETGALPILQELLEPFLEHSQYLRTWLISTLLPLLRLDYEYYPQRQSNLSLDVFEKLDPDLAISTLLSGALQQGHIPGDQEISRDLRGLVGPWMYGESTIKRRKLDQGLRRSSIVVSPDPLGAANDVEDNAKGGWVFVYKWLLEVALRDFSKIVNVVKRWDGPRDVDYGGWDDNIAAKDEASLQTSMRQYAQAALAAIYVTDDEEPTAFEGGHSILVRVSQLVGLLSPPDLALAEAIPSMEAPAPGYLQSISQADFLQDALLQAQNPLTVPNGPSISFLYHILVSAVTLETLGHSLTCRKIAELASFGTEAEQREELRKTVHSINTTKAKDDNYWKTVRQRLLWLQDWEFTVRNQGSDESVEPQGVFCKIGKESLEKDILKAFLIGTCMLEL
ncbi:MAG: hypothetical protein LQ347_001055 [Umbilicaria vellea]|nr:MAG: hypothetical protein LQ347_001055 [Umbilicaria vellea]